MPPKSSWDIEPYKCTLTIEIRFVKGRLKFGNAKDSAPFPSMVVIYRGDAP